MSYARYAGQSNHLWTINYRQTDVPLHAGRMPKSEGRPALDPAWWEPMATLEAEVLDEVRAQAWELAQVEATQCCLLDRVGPGSRVVLRGGRVLTVGAVTERLTGAIVVDGDVGTSLVRAEGVHSAQGLHRAMHHEVPGYARVGSWLRAHVHGWVTICTSHGECIAGTLVAAWADHVDVQDYSGERRSIAIAAIDCVRF